MKKAVSVLLCASLAVSLSAPVLASEEKVQFDEVGMAFALPEELYDATGYIEPYPAGAIDADHTVYFMTFLYEAMPKDEAEERLYAEEATEEEQQEVMAKQFYFGSVVATEGELDKAVQTIEDNTQGALTADKDNVQEIGTADGFTFYSVPFVTDTFFGAIDEEFKEEYTKLEQAVTEAEKGADFSRPVDPEKDLVGAKLTFTTTDKDGNTVTSEELFADNEITMLNCWGLWCPNCTGEIGELAEIHKRMQEKGCGIIGIEYERDPSEETYAEAAELLKQNGVEYPNVLIPDTPEFDSIQGFPTSIFVDKEGNVLCMPIGGPQVDVYEEVLDALLAGKAPVQTENAVPAGDSAAALYTVTVTDGNAPVEGVSLQFCDDTSCRIEETDEDGIVKLEGKAGTGYEVHVVDVPDGYASDETVYNFQGGPGLTITLQKES